MSQANIRLTDLQTVETAIDWLDKLVGFDTRNGTGDEIACANFLRGAIVDFKPDEIVMETVARSRGKPDSAYVMARWGQPNVILNVHIDTVPSGQGWETDPFKLHRKDDKLYGLGACDIKGAAACILAALGTTQPKNVAVLFSGDEEHGSEVIPAVIKRGHYARAPMAIVCEPTECTVGRRHRGMLAFAAHFSGPGGHSSRADFTPAPLLGATRLATAIGDYGRDHLDFGEDPYKGLCVNIGDIKSDGAYNVIPTQASLYYSMRPPPGDSVAERARDMQALHQSLCLNATLDQLVALNPFASHDEKAFKPIFTNTEIVDLPYWTEAAMFSEAGVNVVVYGPGNIAQAHKPNEYVEIEQFSIAIEAYSRAITGQHL